MNAAQIRERIDTELQPSAAAAAERAREAAEQTRARAAEAAEQTRARAEEARARATAAAETARQRADDVRERAEDVADHTRGWLTDVAETLGPLLSRLLQFLSDVFGRLAEGGRQAAARVEAPRSVRRRRRMKAAGWFAGGFTLGALVGWLVHSRMQSEPQSAETIYGDLAGADEVGDSPYGKDAEAIDARRQNALG